MRTGSLLSSWRRVESDLSGCCETSSGFKKQFDVVADILVVGLLIIYLNIESHKDSHQP